MVLIIILICPENFSLVGQ